MAGLDVADHMIFINVNLRLLKTVDLVVDVVVVDFVVVNVVVGALLVVTDHFIFSCGQ